MGKHRFLKYIFTNFHRMSKEQMMRLLLEPWEQELIGQLIDFRAEVTWFRDITETLDGLDNVNYLHEVSVTMSSHFENLLNTSADCLDRLDEFSFTHVLQSPQRSSFIPVLGIICEPLSKLLIDKILHKLESVLRRFIDHVEAMCTAVEPELRALTEVSYKTIILYCLGRQLLQPIYQVAFLCSVALRGFIMNYFYNVK
ncbi:hypothetical protein AHF37_08929 [Paragonimus kellicotti]|nr:hypothetical protein AHF37_08929 [Paragonimus kellicotti]